MHARNGRRQYVPTVTLVVTAPSSAGAVTNTAAVSSSNDSNAANNSATAVEPVAASTADVSLTKSANAATISPGGQISYTITATNNGPATASAVTVSDTPTGWYDVRFSDAESGELLGDSDSRMFAGHASLGRRRNGGPGRHSAIDRRLAKNCRRE